MQRAASGVQTRNTRSYFTKIEIIKSNYDVLELCNIPKLALSSGCGCSSKGLDVVLIEMADVGGDSMLKVGL